MKLVTLALEMIARGAALVAALLFVKRGEKIKDLENENEALETYVDVNAAIRSLSDDQRRRLLASWASREATGTQPNAANDAGYVDDE